MSGVTCHVGSANPVKVNAGGQTLQRILDVAVTTRAHKVCSGVPDQPMNAKDTRTGAVNRVQAMLDDVSTAEHDMDWFMAFEGGVEMTIDGPVTFAYVAIFHRGEWSVTRSSSLPLPPVVYHALSEGQELGDVMDQVFNTTNIKQQGGAIGLLTNHLATRQSVYELAVTLAMARFNHPDLYKG